jgi:hypothetical protein
LFAPIFIIALTIQHRRFSPDNTQRFGKTVLLLLIADELILSKTTELKKKQPATNTSFPHTDTHFALTSGSSPLTVPNLCNIPVQHFYNRATNRTFKLWRVKTVECVFNRV